MDELLQFLDMSKRSDLREIAMKHLLGITSTDNGRAMISRRDDCITRLIQMSDDSDPAILILTLQSLVNLSSDEEFGANLVSNIEHGMKLVRNLLRMAVGEQPDANADIQDASCMVLSNLSRRLSCCQLCWQHVALDKGLSNLEKVVTALCHDVYSVNHLAMFLCNLSHLEECRKQLMDKESGLIRRLLPLLNYMKSDIRRKGVAGVIRNCCFDCGQHDWLLGNKVGILIAVVYPLAGPEEFDEDEMSQLPLELQYLGEDKCREPNSAIRKMLIESINQDGRKYIRDQRIYLIMREFHKWETEDEVVVACENLVDILIGDEPQAGMENLKEITIPDDLIEKFDKMNNDVTETLSLTSVQQR